MSTLYWGSFPTPVTHPTPTGVDVHLYDLRAWTNVSGSQAKQAQTQHYVNHFQTTFLGVPVTSVGPGTVLEGIVNARLKVLDLIEFTLGDKSFRIVLDLAKDRAGKVIPGVILYKLFSRGERKQKQEQEAPDATKGVVAEADMMKRFQVNLGGTVGGQALAGQRVVGWGMAGASLGAGLAAAGTGAAVVTGGAAAVPALSGL